jgi:hypothetical protein
MATFFCWPLYLIKQAKFLICYGSGKFQNDLDHQDLVLVTVHFTKLSGVSCAVVTNLSVSNITHVKCNCNSSQTNKKSSNVFADKDQSCQPYKAKSAR